MKFKIGDKGTIIQIDGELYEVRLSEYELELIKVKTDTTSPKVDIIHSDLLANNTTRTMKFKEKFDLFINAKIEASNNNLSHGAFTKVKDFVEDELELITDFDTLSREKLVELLQNCWSDSAYNHALFRIGKNYITFSEWVKREKI